MAAQAAAAAPRSPRRCDRRRDAEVRWRRGSADAGFPASARRLASSAAAGDRRFHGAAAGDRHPRNVYRDPQRAAAIGAGAERPCCTNRTGDARASCASPANGGHSVPSPQPRSHGANTSGGAAARCRGARCWRENEREGGDGERLSPSGSRRTGRTGADGGTSAAAPTTTTSCSSVSGASGGR
jgi:hypothetical protein